MQHKPSIMCRIKQLIRLHGDNLTPHEEKYLTNFEVKTSNFYGLPKIHKSRSVIEAVNATTTDFAECHNPEDLKFRPIVAGPACPTHRLSNFVDILLRPYIKHVKSYVRDDIDFLNHLPTNIDKDILLSTFDVSSLYTNISHELGIEAIQYWLENDAGSDQHRVSKTFIVESLKLILENNTFNFGTKHFRQTSGTAMGTKMAPTYATLVLGYLELKLYALFEDKYGPEGREYIKKNFKRYLDDVFCLWDSNKYGDVTFLYNGYNNLVPNMKFTMEQSDTHIAFLYILVNKQGSNISTYVYYKPTDSKSYCGFSFKYQN